MGIIYLVDSNTLIDYLGRLLPDKGKQLVAGIIDRDELTILVITHIELLGFQAADDYLQKCQSIITIAEVIPLVDPVIIDRAILVRRQTKIKLPDAVIAATALIRNLTVVSRNEKDFSRVEGLKYINPHEL